MAGEVHIEPDRVAFPPLGGRAVRLTVAAVLVVGGALQAVAGALDGRWALVAAGAIAAAFGVSVATTARAGTTVTEHGWVDPTRVRNRELAWSRIAKVRITAVGSTATFTVEPWDAPGGTALRLARCRRTRVPDVLEVVRPWAAAAGTEVVDLTERGG